MDAGLIDVDPKRMYKEHIRETLPGIKTSPSALELKILGCLKNREVVCLKELLHRIREHFESLQEALINLEQAGRIECIKPIGFDEIRPDRHQTFNSIFFRELRPVKLPTCTRKSRPDSQIHLSKCPQLALD